MVTAMVAAMVAAMAAQAGMAEQQITSLLMIQLGFMSALVNDFSKFWHSLCNLNSLTLIILYLKNKLLMQEFSLDAPPPFCF